MKTDTQKELNLKERALLINGADKEEVTFLKWGTKAYYGGSNTVAIVEKEDGSVLLVEPDKIMFLK